MGLPVVILCGGKGTRLKALTEDIPKPLIEVGGKPILWHIMRFYAHYGHRDFVLCLGYKGEAIKRWFMDYKAWESDDFTLRFSPTLRHARTYTREPAPWNITFVDTGANTNTGGRIKRAQPYVKGKTFLATYGDGLSDVDLDALVRFHRAGRRTATLTAVRPLSQFGILEIGKRQAVKAFHEKPRMTSWVNGGFFVFERCIFDYLGDNDILERGPFEQLARESEVGAYPHEGFWECMDTYQDNLRLNKLWEDGRPAWAVWRGGAR